MRGRVRQAVDRLVSSRVTIFNVLLVAFMGTSINMMHRYMEPTIRGFFCDDQSLAHPFKSNTISGTLLLTVAVALPISVIILVELTFPADPRMTWAPRLAMIGNTVVGQLFGLLVTIFLTYVAKYTVGRLRPNFFELCNPDWSAIDCGTEQRPIYVTNYTCLGPKGPIPNWVVTEARVSFVSGHASIAWSTAVFLVLYLQARLMPRYHEDETTSYSLFIPFIQLIFVAAAFFTGLTRIMDYWHHPGDVVAGGILGAVVQYYNCVHTMLLFQDDSRRDHEVEGLSQDTAMTDGNVGTTVSLPRIK